MSGRKPRRRRPTGGRPRWRPKGAGPEDYDDSAVVPIDHVKLEAEISRRPIDRSAHRRRDDMDYDRYRAPRTDRRFDDFGDRPVDRFDERRGSFALDAPREAPREPRRDFEPVDVRMEDVKDRPPSRGVDRRPRRIGLARVRPHALDNYFNAQPPMPDFRSVMSNPYVTEAIAQMVAETLTRGPMFRGGMPPPRGRGRGGARGRGRGRGHAPRGGHERPSGREEHRPSFDGFDRADYEDFAAYMRMRDSEARAARRYRDARAREHDRRREEAVKKEKTRSAEEERDYRLRKISEALDYLFSDGFLKLKDADFLKGLMEEPEGWIKARFIAALKPVHKLFALSERHSKKPPGVQEIVDAAALAKSVEVEGTNVRRRGDFARFMLDPSAEKFSKRALEAIAFRVEDTWKKREQWKKYKEKKAKEASAKEDDGGDEKVDSKVESKTDEVTVEKAKESAEKPAVEVPKEEVVRSVAKTEGATGQVDVKA